MSFLKSVVFILFQVLRNMTQSSPYLLLLKYSLKKSWIPSNTMSNLQPDLQSHKNSHRKLFPVSGVYQNVPQLSSRWTKENIKQHNRKKKKINGSLWLLCPFSFQWSWPANAILRIFLGLAPAAILWFSVTKHMTLFHLHHLPRTSFNYHAPNLFLWLVRILFFNILMTFSMSCICFVSHKPTAFQIPV